MVNLCIIPAYNEEKTIKEVVLEANSHSDITVVIDDGSSDNTLDTLKNIRSDLFVSSPIYVLQNPGNLGKGKSVFNAYWWGYWNIDLKDDDLIIVMDADGQHDPKHIPRMIKFGEKGGFDMVVGKRDISKYPSYKRLGNWGLSKMSSWLSRCKIEDGESGYRVMRWGLVKSLMKNMNPNGYELEMQTNMVAGRLGYTIGFFKLKGQHYRKGVSLRNGLMNGYNGLMLLRKKMKR